MININRCLNSEENYNYLKTIIFVHGKSSLKICQYIKQNFRLDLDMEIVEVGKDNVIEEVKIKLNDFQTFIKNYEVDYNKVKNKIENFRIFVIMNLDYFENKNDKDTFIDKSIFEDIWAFEYITTIYNINTVEEVFNDSGVKGKERLKNNKEKSYFQVLPLNIEDDKKMNDKDQIIYLVDKIKENSKTNLDEFLNYCLYISI